MQEYIILSSGTLPSVVGSEAHHNNITYSTIIQLFPTSVWPPMTSHYWSVSTSLASYHLSILITINSELSTIDGPRRTYINFKKADRARYSEACDEYVAEAGVTRTVEQAEKTFRKAVNKASGLFIPAGHIQHFQPTLSASAKSFADELEQKRGLNPTDETPNDLIKQIQKLVVEDKQTKWQSAVHNCDHRTGISHPWQLVKGLCSRKTAQLAQHRRQARR